MQFVLSGTWVVGFIMVKMPSCDVTYLPELCRYSLVLLRLAEKLWRVISIKNAIGHKPLSNCHLVQFQY